MTGNRVDGGAENTTDRTRDAHTRTTDSATSQEDGAEQVVHAELSESFAVNPTGTPSQPADDAYDSDGIELTVTAERAAVRIARSRAESEHLYV